MKGWSKWYCQVGDIAWYGQCAVAAVFSEAASLTPGFLGMLQRFEKDLAAAEGVGAVSVEAKPRMQGNTMNMILAIGKKE